MQETSPLHHASALPDLVLGTSAVPAVLGFVFFMVTGRLGALTAADNLQ